MNSNFAIINQYCNTALKADGYSKALVVDTQKAHYQGRLWKNLSTFDKRKLENLIVILHSDDRIKIIYQ